MISGETHVVALLKRARDGDTDAAAEILGVAAIHFEAGEPLPTLLSEHLARAFRTVAELKPRRDGASPDAVRRSRLASLLGITKPANRPRKAVGTADIGVALIMGAVPNLTSAVARKYGVTKNTARDRIADAKRTVAIGREIMAEIVAANGLVKVRQIDGK